MELITCSAFVFDASARRCQYVLLLLDARADTGLTIITAFSLEVVGVYKRLQTSVDIYNIPVNYSSMRKTGFFTPNLASTRAAIEAKGTSRFSTRSMAAHCSRQVLLIDKTADNGWATAAAPASCITYR